MIDNFLKMLSSRTQILCKRIKDEPRMNRVEWREALNETPPNTIDGAMITLSLVENLRIGNSEISSFLGAVIKNFDIKTEIGLKARFLWRNRGFPMKIEDEREMLEIYLVSGLAESESFARKLRSRLSNLTDTSSSNPHLFCSYSLEFLEYINEKYPEYGNLEKIHPARKMFINEDKCNICRVPIKNHDRMNSSCPYIIRNKEIVYTVCDFCGFSQGCHQKDLAERKEKDDTFMNDFGRFVRNLPSYFC